MIEFKVHGFPALYRDLKQLDLKDQYPLLLKAARAGATLIKDRMGQLAPRGHTGKLAGSMIISGAGQRNDVNRIVLLIGPSTKAFYGLFQEIGTAFHSPQPFLSPAFIEMQEQAIAKVASTLRTAIDRKLAA